METVEPEFDFTVKVIKLLFVIAEAASVGVCEGTLVPQALPAGVPLVLKALPLVKPPIVKFEFDVVADCGELPPPVYPLKSHAAIVIGVSKTVILPAT